MPISKTCRRGVSVPLKRVAEKSAAYRLPHSWHCFSVILARSASHSPGHVRWSARSVSSSYPFCTPIQVMVGPEPLPVEGDGVTEGQAASRRLASGGRALLPLFDQADLCDRANGRVQAEPELFATDLELRVICP